MRREGYNWQCDTLGFLFFQVFFFFFAFIKASFVAIVIGAEADSYKLRVMESEHKPVHSEVCW